MSENKKHDVVIGKDGRRDRKSIDIDNLTLQDWTKSEKFLLLQAIKEYGSKNLKEINEKIPSKSARSIQLAIKYYKRRALGYQMRVLNQMRNKNRVKNMPRIPLARWAKYLTDSLNFEDLHTETATALRLIAEFENIPSAVCTENIDFRKLYNIIANAMEGKAMPEDILLKTVLDKCIIEAAMTSKAFIRNSYISEIIKSISMSNKDIYLFPMPTSDHEVAAIRHLASQRTYNPLNISETYLKPSP